jgi:hypothetical protein
MILQGFKDVVRAAYEQHKFLTNGQQLPRIDFSQPLLVEVTALDSMNLVSYVRMENDKIMQFGKEFDRTLYLQLIPDCQPQNTLLEMIVNHEMLAGAFTGVKKVRVSIIGYTAFGQAPYRIPEKVEEVYDTNRGAERRKLVIEKAQFRIR